MSVKRGYSFDYFPGWWLPKQRVRQTFARIIGRVWGFDFPLGSRCKLCGAPLRPWHRQKVDAKNTYMSAADQSCQNRLCDSWCPF